jgi:hypothetical protein
MKMNIHNRYSGFKSTSRTWFKRGANWYKEPDDKVDANGMTSAGLTSTWITLEGCSTYQLQKVYQI